MSLALYMDHHVDGDITRGLRRRGLDVLTAREDGTAAWSDERLFERAAALGRLLFTQDDDFMAIAVRWFQEGRDFPGLVYAHQLDISVGQAVTELELIAKVYDPEDMRNRIEYLPYS